MSILVPSQTLPNVWKNKMDASSVFYNPVMEFNRDISILALESYGGTTNRKVHVLDAMTGCGVRGVRYAAEVDGVADVLLNDFQKVATDLAIQNVTRNGVSDRARVVCMDANLVLASHAAPDNRFDVIDIDPFGSPAPFLDSAIRATSNGALVALTATDMAPLCGVRPNAAFRKYGGRPLRTEYCKEIGIRLLIASLATTAARHDLGIEIKLAHSTDHYVRVYATVRRGGTRGNRTLGRLGYIAHCFHCSNRKLSDRLAIIESVCKVCGHRYAFAGPLWLGNLHDKEFCKQMLNLIETKKLGKKNRAKRFLERILGEIDCLPTYYMIDRLCDKYQIPLPKPKDVVGKLQKNGYLASLTHFHGNGVRTDAGSKVLMEVLSELSEKSGA